MTLLVTGGNGFVMSHLVRAWLETNPASRVIVLDRAAPDAARQSFLGSHAGRVEYLSFDIARSDGGVASDALREVEMIVHGAAVTPHPYRDDVGTLRDPEREAPEAVVETNIRGTTAMLDLARRSRRVRRFVFISSCAAYGRAARTPPHLPLREEDEVAPETLYGISKFASEMLVRRYAALYGLSAVSVRLGPIFGPLDRPSPDRHVRDVPNQVASLAVARQPLRIQALDGVGDWLHAGDAANALVRLLQADRLAYDLYNVASGAVETVERLVDHVATVVAVDVAPAGTGPANVACDPDRRLGSWGGYAIDRIRYELGWEPRPLRRSFPDYLGWLSSQSPSSNQ